MSKIVLCGSMTVVKKMKSLEEELINLNHEVTLPEFTDDYVKLDSINEMHAESAQNKINHDLIRGYWHKIKEGDAILVVNEKRNGVENYIGGNTFLEMGFAHVLFKSIYLLNPIPNVNYRDEIEVMITEVLNGDLTKIK